MRYLRFGAICLTLLPVMGLAAAPLAAASELLTNGNFETGNFNGWTVNTQSGSSGALAIVPNGPATSPRNGLAYLNNPTGGSDFAETSQTGPGAYSLSQSFTTNGSANITISFQYFAESNGTSAYVNGTNPNNYNNSPNENAAAYLLNGSNTPFTALSPSQIAATLVAPGLSSTTPDGSWITVTDNLGVLAAGTFTLVFNETDNEGVMSFGVDNASVQSTPVPEPASLALFGTGLAGLGWLRRRKRA